MKTFAFFLTFVMILAVLLISCGRDSAELQGPSKDITTSTPTSVTQPVYTWGTPSSTDRTSKDTKSTDWDNTIQICGTVFISPDCSNLLFPGAVGIPNVTITLHADGIDRTTTTGPNGAYCFYDLPIPPPTGTTYTTCLDVSTLPQGVGTKVFPRYGTSQSNCQTGLDFGSVGDVDFGICGTPPPPPAGGCTRTIGYYKTHAVPNLYGNNQDQVSAYLPISLGNGGPKTVVVTLNTQVVSIMDKGAPSASKNGILKLYAQLLAAKLSIKGAGSQNGSSDGSCVASAIASADAFLGTHNGDDWNSLSKADQGTVLSWMTTLDNYNNGLMCAPHCD